MRFQIREERGMMDKLSNVLLPIAEKLSQNRYLTVRDGFTVSIMPLVIMQISYLH